MTIEDFIDSSNKADNVDALFALYRAAMEQLGFDRLVFSLLTDHTHIQRPAGHGILVNYSEEWMEHYTKKDYVNIDPVRQQLYAANGIFLWNSLLTETSVTDRQIVMMNEGIESGLYDGIAVPLWGPRGALAGVGAASSAGGVDLRDPNLLSRAQLLSQQFYTAFQTLEAKRLGSTDNAVYLSDREREVLKWCARGKTKSEIGEILALSEHTVHGYIKTALRKLDANNITLGVLRALNMGLIQI
ncbi:MAG: LuxR family transcriptional regulator [Micavibrio sp.]|nr:LuxR family transcriptional regulator [Micavibrio sp.]